MASKKPKASDDPLSEDWEFIKRGEAVNFVRSRGLQVDMPESNLDWITIWALIGWQLYHEQLNKPRTGRPRRWNKRVAQLLADTMKRSNKDWSKNQSASGFAEYLHKNYPNEFEEQPTTLARSLSPIFKELRRQLRKTT
jgi:hypothetical protein